MECRHVNRLCMFPLKNQSVVSPREWICGVEQCAVTTESVWACLSCPSVACGRRVEQHALKHFHKTTHPLAIEASSCLPLATPHSHQTRGGFRGGGRTPPSPSGIRPPADPKGPPFDTFSEIHFWPTDPKIFLKAPLAPICTNFEGERAPKKKRFFCQSFSKSAQKRLF